LDKLNFNFKRIIYRLLAAGILVFVLIQGGIWLYQKSIDNINNEVNVKNLSVNIEKAITKNLNLQILDKTVILKPEDLKGFVELYTRYYNNQKDYRIANDKVVDYLKSIVPNIETPAVDARLQYTAERAEVFTPSRPGIKLDIEKSAAAIENAIGSNQDIAVLVVNEVEPDITLEKINSLGINAIIGTGESNFGGSSTARIQNIRIGASKYNGLILKPGEEFSFNTLLGEVDEKSGYLAEKVIKGHQIVYEYGGGLCQVSTTLFRAAIAAGFPIVERRPHAFPVQYYNPQGFDATIYPGVTDLKFINNSSNHILLQSRIVGKKITFEIYGTNDGRKVTIDGPYQYDQQLDGSMKAYFNRKIVFAGGTIKDERFDSNYKSPALYPLQKNPLE